MFKLKCGQWLFSFLSHSQQLERLKISKTKRLFFLLLYRMFSSHPNDRLLLLSSPVFRHSNFSVSWFLFFSRPYAPSLTHTHIHTHSLISPPFVSAFPFFLCLSKCQEWHCPISAIKQSNHLEQYEGRGIFSPGAQGLVLQSCITACVCLCLCGQQVLDISKGPRSKWP